MTSLVVIVWQDVPLPGMLPLLSSLSLLCIRAGEGLIPEKPLSSSSSSSDTMAQNKKLIKRIVWPWHILTCCSFHRRLTLNTTEGKKKPPHKVFLIWPPYQDRQNIHTLLVKTLVFHSVCVCYWKSNIPLCLFWHSSPGSGPHTTRFWFLKNTSQPQWHTLLVLLVHALCFQTVKPLTALSRIILKRDRKDWKTHQS